MMWTPSVHPVSTSAYLLPVRPLLGELAEFHGKHSLFVTGDGVLHRSQQTTSQASGTRHSRLSQQRDSKALMQSPLRGLTEQCKR